MNLFSALKSDIVTPVSYLSYYMTIYSMAVSYNNSEAPFLCDYNYYIACQYKESAAHIRIYSASYLKIPHELNMDHLVHFRRVITGSDTPKVYKFTILRTGFHSLHGQFVQVVRVRE